LIKSGLSPVFVAARSWLSKGWPVVPAQPNSKHLVAGFGLYKDKIETGDKMRFWFQEHHQVNLAVVARADGGVILDFDDIEVYFQFCKRWPELAASYTESTPRSGRHLFLRTSEPIRPGLVLLPGIEVKQIVLVYPSKVGGQFYRVVVPGEILSGNVQEALQPFLVQDGDKAPAPSTVCSMGAPVVKMGHKKDTPRYIEDLKSRWPILDYLHYFEPNLLLTGRGRWLSGRCPWHDDHAPSLWVDVERNIWGCHACHIGGDILDWHKRRMESNNIGQAVRDLARYRVEMDVSKNA
jgi:Bifunctional DNA primase/polymerase, N-terminal/CHC2 zinc finger